jgi:long-chain fatty acid transport protein
MRTRSSRIAALAKLGFTSRAQNCPEISARNPKRPPQSPGLGLAFRGGAVVFGLAMAAAACYGSAFSVSELGARAAGMGTAFIGVADDGSALFYNPAGIAFQPGAHMQMDATTVVGLFRFTPSATPVGQVVPADGYSESIKPHFIPLASLYATMQLSPKVTVGVGMFTPFGLAANSTNFNDSDPDLTKYVGRFAGTRAALQSYWFQPTIAYRLTSNSSIAIGPTFVHTHLFIEKSFLNPIGDALTFGVTAAPTIFPGVPVNEAAAVIARLLPEGRSRVAGTANSPALSLGYLWKHPSGKINVGFMYRSAVTNHLAGKASFAFGTGYTLEQYIGSSFLFNQFPDQAVTGSFTTPATYGFGIRNTSLFGIALSFDLRLQDYHRFQSVPLDFPINSVNAGVALPPEQRLVFNFHDSMNLAVGLEKALNPRLTVRCGYMFDLSPVPDESVGPLFPDANRNSFTAGGTMKSGNKEFTFFYEAMKFSNRVTNVADNDDVWTNGDYRNFAHVAGLSMRFEMSDFVKKMMH